MKDQKMVSMYKYYMMCAFYRFILSLQMIQLLCIDK